MWHKAGNETGVQLCEGYVNKIERNLKFVFKQQRFFIGFAPLQVAKEKKNWSWHALFLLLEKQMSEHWETLFIRIAGSKVRKWVENGQCSNLFDCVEMKELSSITIFKSSAGPGVKHCLYWTPLIDHRIEGKDYANMALQGRPETGKITLNSTVGMPYSYGKSQLQILKHSIEMLRKQQQ